MIERILMTGGTGFFGKSLLSMLRRGFLPGVSFTILSRDPEAFLRKNPEFSDLKPIAFLRGDVRDFPIPERQFDAMILGATPASVTVADEEMRSIIMEGTRHSLDAARRCGVKKLLLLSSGAVYGRQQEAFVAETAPCRPVTAYGQAKLEAEKLCFASGIPAVSARCFAFAGPYLDRNIHFAIGNFIRDALAGTPIVIRGDGTPYRTYLYADDLIRWLFRLLSDGREGAAYNVGSDAPVSIAELARTVADTLAPGLPVKILGTPVPGAPPERYVPDVSLSRRENLASETVGLREAIRLSAAPGASGIR